MNELGFFTASSTPGHYPEAIEVLARQDSPVGLLEKRAFASITISQSAQLGTLSELVTIPHSVVLTPGQEVSLIARALDGIGLRVRDVDITWEVTEPAAGEITRPGSFVAGDRLGQYPEAIRAVATQQTSNGFLRAKASLAVTVVPPRTNGVLEVAQLIPGEVTLARGQLFLFTPIGMDSAGSLVPGSVHWEIADSAAGSIKSSGVFKAGSTPGMYKDAVRVRITQVIGGDQTAVEAFATINVLGPLDSIRIVSSLTLESGRSSWLTAVGHDGNGLEIPSLHFRWSIEDPLAGTITPNGFFTAGDRPGSYANAVKVVAVELDSS